MLGRLRDLGHGRITSAAQEGRQRKHPFHVLENQCLDLTSLSDDLLSPKIFLSESRKKTILQLRMPTVPLRMSKEPTNLKYSRHQRYFSTLLASLVFEWFKVKVNYCLLLYYMVFRSMNTNKTNKTSVKRLHSSCGRILKPRGC